MSLSQKVAAIIKLASVVIAGACVALGHWDIATFFAVAAILAHLEAYS
jgi:hypothetical protein